MGSTRLPRKVLMDVEGISVLEHVVRRVKNCTLISDVIVATTIAENDLAIVKLCAEKGFRVFCGSEDDVLDRFYQIAKLLLPEHIVRITADCPLMDALVIDKVIEKHLLEHADYTSNTMVERYPDGEDVEVFTYKSLERSWKDADLVSEREHVTPYIRTHKEVFKQASVEYEIDVSSKRWTLDNQEDYEFIIKVYKALYHKNNYFGMKEILAFLKEHPEHEKINSNIKRNEGYEKSLKEDKKLSK